MQEKWPVPCKEVSIPVPHGKHIMLYVVKSQRASVVVMPVFLLDAQIFSSTTFGSITPPEQDPKCAKIVPKRFVTQSSSDGHIGRA